MDLKGQTPFNLFPNELKLEDFISILDSAVEDVFHQRPQSENLKRVIGFLNGFMEMSKSRFESLDENEKHAFITHAYWMNELRQRFENGRSDFNPLFPFRIQPWLYGKRLLLQEVFRSPRGPNAERVMGFLATWQDLAKQHSTRLIRL